MILVRLITLAIIMTTVQNKLFQRFCLEQKGVVYRFNQIYAFSFKTYRHTAKVHGSLTKTASQLRYKIILLFLNKRVTPYSLFAFNYL